MLKRGVFAAVLRNQKNQKSKTGSTFSKCFSILFRVLQVSNLGSLLFLIFFVDLFYLICDLDLPAMLMTPLLIFVDRTLAALCQ